VAYLPLAGGTMTWPLIQAADPVAALGTATKQYVDAGTTAAEHNIGRNLLHNSLFNVQQRGAGPWGTNVYTADRWLLNVTLDAISLNLTAASDATRAAIGDESVSYVLANSVTGNAGATAYTNLLQRIEKVGRLAGKTVTVSFWAAASASGLKLGVGIDQAFGSGGSPSPAVFGAGQPVTLSTTWARYSVTLVLPSVAGKTLGTNGDDFTQLALWYSAGANSATRAGNIGVQSGTITLWGVQLEIGATATPLEKPDPQQDLAKCQRFYTPIVGLILGSYGAAAGNLWGSWTLPVVMRAAPTVTPNSISYGGSSALNISAASTSAFQATVSVASTGAAFVQFGVQCSADL
jgi:hypothetical protein